MCEKGFDFSERFHSEKKFSRKDLPTIEEFEKIMEKRFSNPKVIEIDTTNAYNIYEKAIKKSDGKFLDDGVSFYFIKRAIEFEKNGFVYTLKIEDYQERVNNLIFNIFK